MKTYYFDTTDYYMMIVNGYDCILLNEDNDIVERITDTEINAKRYFENRFGIKLIKVKNFIK